MYVTINNVTFGYTKDELVLDNLSLAIKKGQIMALLGDSGSGKSTLLRIIAGLEDHQRGEIIINHQVLASKDVFIPAERRNVGMVFQNYALFPHMTVEQNIAYGCTETNKKKRLNHVKELLKLVHLPHKHKKYPHELSGGEQQRIALARSLAANPDLLLLDEPFSNLDTELKSKLRYDILAILNNANTTVLLVTHDKEDANILADTTYLITNGSIEKDLN